MLAASKAAPQLEGFHTRTPFNRSSTVSVLRFGEQRCKHPPLRLLLLLARQSGRNRLSIYTGAAREITRDHAWPRLSHEQFCAEELSIIAMARATTRAGSATRGEVR